MNLKVALVGPGAIGITLARHLEKNGLKLTCFARRPANQYHIIDMTKGGEEDHFSLDVYQKVEEQHVGQFDLVIFCLKNQVLMDTFADYSRLVHSEGYIMCAQNGLMEYFIRDHFPEERIIGAVIKGNAIYEAPNKATRTFNPEYTIGRILPKSHPVRSDKNALLSSIFEKLRSMEHFIVVDDVIPYKWAKLALNCTTNPLSTIYGSDPYQVLMTSEGARAAMDIVDEIFLVAKKEKVKIAKDHFWWPALLRKGNGLPYFLKKYYLQHAAQRWKNVKVSMFQDIDASLPTEIDHLNGLITSLGKKHGVSVPMNEKIVEIIKNMEKGKYRPSEENLKLL